MAQLNSNSTYYILTYRDPKDEKILSLKCRDIQDSSLGLGFIAVSEFILSSHKLVIDPEEETLCKRLENVKTVHLSIYSVLSIQEVGEESTGLSFESDKSNVFMMPNVNPKPRTPQI